MKTGTRMKNPMKRMKNKEGAVFCTALSFVICLKKSEFCGIIILKIENFI